MTDSSRKRSEKRSLFAMIGSLPGLLVELVKSEMEQLKSEILRKLKHAGIGVGFLLVACVFAFFAVGVLTAAAVLGLATVVPGWLSALIIGVALLLAAAAVAAIGINQLKRGTPPTPTKTIRSVQRDVRVIKGTAKRSSS